MTAPAPKKKDAAPAPTAPPKNIRLSRGGVVWQNTARWPNPAGSTESLPFRVGDIFLEDEETWVVFGMPDVDKKTGKASSALGDMSDLVIIAWVPIDPLAPVVEALATRADAVTMVNGYLNDAAEDWNAEDEDDEDDAPPKLALAPTEPA